MPLNRKTILRAILIRNIRKRLKRKKRECNIRPIFYNRIQAGENTLVRELSSNPLYHHRYFRMSKGTFDILLNKLTERLSKKRTHARPISPIEKLAITLRYLATGNSQISLAMSYRISPSAVGRILRETMEALCDELEAEHLPPPTVDKWKTIEREFATEWNLPNCCGAIDGKHVRIQAPNLSGSMNYNYKGFFSMVLLAVVDAHYRFVLVDIGASGSMSDGGVLSRSQIGKGLQENLLQLPEDKKVGQDLLPHVIVGDDAFPLRQNLLKPFPGKNLSTEKRIFNYRLSRARIVVENCFGILSARWRIMHTAIIGSPDLIRLVIKSCVLLHNYLIDARDMVNITADISQGSAIIPGNWRENTLHEMDGVRTQGSNNYGSSASETRIKFMTYFNGTGAVGWQQNMI